MYWGWGHWNENNENNFEVLRVRHLRKCSTRWLNRLFISSTGQSRVRGTNRRINHPEITTFSFVLISSFQGGTEGQDQPRLRGAQGPLLLLWRRFIRFVISWCLPLHRNSSSLRERSTLTSWMRLMFPILCFLLKKRCFLFYIRAWLDITDHYYSWE